MLLRPTKTTETVVDWGCGVGKLLSDVYSTYKCKCIGINISEKQIRLARTLYGNGDISFLLTDGESANLHANSVDAVVSQEALTHSPDKLTIFEEFYRILTNNGRLIFQDWFEVDPILSIKADKLYRANVKPSQHYINVLRDVGFSDVQIHRPLDEVPRTGRVHGGIESLVMSCKKQTS